LSKSTSALYFLQELLSLAQISNAKISGAAISSTDLQFTPRWPRPLNFVVIGLR
jgi:RNA 3'-terminal phosphate cyclase